MKSNSIGCLFVLSALTSVAIVVGRCDGQTTQTTVQLPTFHVFGTTTTVIVPDRGSVYLGGVQRSARGQNSFGAPLPGFGNRAFGHASSAGGLSISATIIDHNAIDRALLAEAARRRGARFDVRGRPVAQPKPFAGRAPSGESQLAATYLRRARQAEADGQPHVAMIFYRRLVKHGDTSLIQLAESRLARLESAPAANRKRP